MFTCGFERSNFSFAMSRGALFSWGATEARWILRAAFIGLCTENQAIHAAIWLLVAGCFQRATRFALCHRQHGRRIRAQIRRAWVGESLESADPSPSVLGADGAGTVRGRDGR